jgi:hypothetical protein
MHHVHHYSFKDFRQYVASHIDFFDDLLEKVMETGTLIIVAGFIFMIIMVLLTLNHANHEYVHGIACLACNSIQIVYNSVQGFM